MRVDVTAFERMYRRDEDPWMFAQSAYELRRYEATVEILGAKQYRRCFEPGCSIGVLTRQLSKRCESVVACDTSTAAIETACRRNVGAGGIDFVVATLPEWWPSGTFDLVVVSELGYYWDEPDLGALVERFAESTEKGGDIVAVHWLGSSPDHLLDGDAVHRVFNERLGSSVEQHEHHDPEHDGFVIERWIVR